MENLLGSLKRENKEREKRLTLSDRRLLSDMIGYIKTQKICDYDVEEIRKTIIRNTLRVYGSKKKNLQTLAGDDYREYCDKLCENKRKITAKEFVLSRGVTVIYALALMYIARLFDVMITGGNFFKEPVDINMGYISATAALLIGILATYMYVAKLMRDTGMKMTQKQTMGMLGILALIMVAACAGAYFLSDIHLFDVTWWIPVVILLVIFAVFKMLYIQYENKMAKEA